MNHSSRQSRLFHSGSVYLINIPRLSLFAGHQLCATRLGSVYNYCELELNETFDNMEYLSDTGANNEDDDMGDNESVMSVLNKFVQAVDSMDETVMIPSRLRDMEINTTTGPTLKEVNNNKAVVPIFQQGTDLLSFYNLLKTIKTDLTLGQMRTGVENDNTSGASNVESDTDDSSKKAASAFRFHLRGLFNVLRQMTTTANFLTEKYVSEVDETRRASISSFTI